MAAYEKATLATFKTKLQADGYKNLAGAKKSIGKSSFSDEDKAKALKLAEKHFGETPAKPAAKKSATKKTVATKAPKAAKAAATKAPAKPKATKSKTTKAKAGKGAVTAKVSEGTTSAVERITTINYAAGTVQHMLAGMQQARDLGAPESEVAVGAQQAQRALLVCVGEVLSVVEGGKASPADLAQAAQIKQVADAVGAGGNHKPEGPMVPAIVPPVAPPTPPTS